MKLPDAFSPEVMAELAKPARLFDPRAAELISGVTAQWCVVEIAARDVEEELIKRRFGIYVPECNETVVMRGRKRDRRVSMFPGYVFVFLWPTDRNWHLLATTPGVVAILGALPHVEVDDVRYRENCERPIVLECFEEHRDVQKKRRKKWRRTSTKRVLVMDEIIGSRPWSAFEDAVSGLDSGGRNQALRELFGFS